MTSRRVLVTGGSGFIGHHVIDYLMAETDWDVVVLDSLSYAGDPTKVTDIPSFDPERIQMVWHDLRAPIAEPTRDRIGAIDAIYNLASASHVDTSIADPVPFVMNNVAVALHMLEYARATRPSIFVQFSTDEVYGPTPYGARFAEWTPHIPSNPYSASKSAQEAIAISYWRTFGVPVVITNTMNVFGERQHPEKFIARSARQLLLGEPVTVHGELIGDEWQSGSRHWLYVRDAAEALVFLTTRIQAPRYPDTDRPERFHLVGPDELTNLQIAELVADALEVPLRYEWVDFHGSRPGHDRRYALDGSKLARLGWKPTIGVREGVSRAVREWKNTGSEAGNWARRRRWTSEVSLLTRADSNLAHADPSPTVRRKS
jgi:dTDP-glucose 4,6-dehydratase